MKKIAILLTMMTVALMATAQMANPVKFTSQLKTTNGSSEGEIIFTGTIDKGWHVYSTNLGDAGPTEAAIVFHKKDGVEPVGKLKAVGKEISQFDEMFGAKLRFFENNVKFVQKVKFTKPNYDIDVDLEYGACNDQSCLPPSSSSLKKSGKSPAVDGETDKNKEEEDKAKAEAEAKAKADSLAALQAAAADSAAMNAPVDSAALAALDHDALWKPVVGDIQRIDGTDGGSGSRSLWYIFLLGLLGGLVALFTPCVWPIIPMTVSFFLKRAKNDKKKGIKDAITYGISIVVIYLLLGLIVTAIFGPSALNALSTNAVFNIFLCLLLVVFALSFFGMFEIKLPSKWSNAVDNKASSTSGLLSIFLMAFTLALVSFSCTGPIIGFLLVDFATSGNFWGPAIGMLGFALALALPFTLFALFPSWLKSAPKSGGWMNILKVVLGFIELAFACKFFSVADLAYGWHLMDREVFLCLWIAIFGLLGLYLIGKLKFQSDIVMPGDETKPMPVICIMGGLISIAFAIYMIPGLWGAPCKAVSAFAPPMNTQDFNLNTKEVRAAYTDYEQGMAAAAAAGKPVFLDFTGFGCVNCRKMEAAVLDDEQVKQLIHDNFVTTRLMVDDKTDLKTSIFVQENGKNVKLSTVGDKWSYLQSSKFGANAQPFYVLLDNQGNPLAPSYSYDEDVSKYVDFLRGGLNKYKNVE